MPKHVDHEERRQTIASATWKVIAEKGAEAATVRTIAEAAGLSLGALRYYFKTQDELIGFTLELVKERVQQRIQRILEQQLPPAESTLRILLEMIPHNEETYQEMSVWFQFMNGVRQRIFSPESDDMLQGITLMMTQLEQHDLLKNELDMEVEIERLRAVVDGLALHAMISPEKYTEEKLIRILKTHLNEIFAASEKD
ncbi:TetR family transcriptional regulator C-terminal domain-containing protein [Mesobacillus subterraneus]|uniref:TetR/AcrR family transcriptional regulator n=1 Tax=Mesobacillus subterraneus TaxID=285983 RepID=UPI00273F4B3D|nr:TetR family transcriptional regulator C-terminal domain-containing protein [Mesobacillus subterraneus]WLR54685.1 TetR family transcriptional regulator C-terminal domain-containing protein [Mesobacillus subterraneus]